MGLESNTAIEDLVFELYQSGEDKSNILKSLLFSFVSLANMDREGSVKLLSKDLLDTAKKLIV